MVALCKLACIAQSDLKRGTVEKLVACQNAFEKQFPNLFQVVQRHVIREAVRTTLRLSFHNGFRQVRRERLSCQGSVNATSAPCPRWNGEAKLHNRLGKQGLDLWTHLRPRKEIIGVLQTEYPGYVNGLARKDGLWRP